MKKKFVIFFTSLVILLLILLLSGPFLTLYSIKESIEEKDSITLSKNIYFPKLRSNIKIQINSSLSKSISEKFNDAVKMAIDIANDFKYGIVLLSPACSSFDQFDSFEHRGKVFKDIIEEHYS